MTNSSVLDLILGQRMILVLVGFAVLLLLVAGVFAVLPRLRKANARRARAQARAQATRVIEIDDSDYEDDDEADIPTRVVVRQGKSGGAKARRQAETDPDDSTVQLRSPKTAAPAADKTPPPAAAPAPVAAPADPATPAPEAAKPAEEPKPEAAKGPDSSVSDTMQSLLDEVFVDEDKLARYAALLRGLGNPDAGELAEVGEDVATRLRAVFNAAEKRAS